ncbi:MAG: glutamate racemase [Armatimonadota bacterium]
MKNNAPVGIFDSGLGGLTVAKCVLEKLPQESIIYIGDQIHVPYGEKTPDQIRRYALGISEYFIKNDCKIIIMACNMSSAYALNAARNTFPKIPIVGTIEAGARAVLRTGLKKIGILATRGTVESLAYTKTITALDKDIVVIEQPCPKFVPLVESGECDTYEAEKTAEEYVRPLIEAGCDSLVFGCTHYPFLLNAIRKSAGNDVVIIDPAEETAIEASEILINAGIQNPPYAEPAHTYYTSAEPVKFAELGGSLLGRNICSVNEITWGLDLREIECEEKTTEQIMKLGR